MIRAISEFDSNPYVKLRLLNKATMATIPSAQERLTIKYKTKRFIELPSTPELWHLLDFKGSLEDLILKDSGRFLPMSLPYILNAIVDNLSSITTINEEELEKMYNMIIRSGLTETFIELVKIYPRPARCTDEEFLIEAALKLGRDFPQLLDNFYYVSHNSYLIAIFINSSEPEEIIEQIESKQFTQDVLLSALFDAAFRSSKDELSFEKFSFLCNSLIRNETFKEIFMNFLLFRFIPQEFDCFRLPYLLPDFNHIVSSNWREFYILEALEHIENPQIFLRPLLNSVRILKLHLSEKVKTALLKKPCLLDPQRAKEILGSRSLEYRIKTEKAQDYSCPSSLTAEDVVLSSHILSDEEFKNLLEEFSADFDFVMWSKLLESLFLDISLLSKLKVLGDHLQGNEFSIGLVFPTISFNVLKAIILDFYSFVNLFQNHFAYQIIITPQVMAQVLRDNDLYTRLRFIKDNLFSKVHFPFTDAIALFTEYDWIRLFDLSLTELNTTLHDNFNELRSSLIIQNSVPLSESLPIIKKYFVNFVTWNFRAMLTPERLVVIDPLTSIWKKKSPDTYQLL